MTVRKTIVPSFVILLAACLLIGFTAFAENGRSTDEEYAPGFYYTVQKGDTLWDLSRKFYDSEWQWPALWGQNKGLSNPHVIHPGERIRLYQRTDPLKQLDSSSTSTITGEEDFSLPEEQFDGPELTMPESVYFMYPGIGYVGFIEKLLPEKGFF